MFLGRGQLGLVNASADVPRSSEQYSAVGARRRAREKLSAAVARPHRNAWITSSTGRFRLLDLQAQFAACLCQYRQGVSVHRHLQMIVSNKHIRFKLRFIT